jgi:hypothetical protein
VLERNMPMQRQKLVGPGDNAIDLCTDYMTELKNEMVM